MRILLLALTPIAAWAQVTATPTSITMYMTDWTYVKALNPPRDTPITVIGTGAWNIARTGGLAGLCNLTYAHCYTVNTTTTNAASATVTPPTGNDATTLYLTWRGILSTDAVVGTYTGTLTIGSTAISVTLVVLPRAAFSPWTYLAGFPVGCTQTASYDTSDTCTITSERPTSTALSIPAPGASYVDPQFGHTITRITPSGNNIQYGAISAFNADSSLIMTNTPAGVVNIYNRLGGTVAYAAVPTVNINNATWSGTDSNTIWFTDGSTIKQRNLLTSTTTTAADYVSASGTRPAMASIIADGTVDATEDNWWSFRFSTTHVCAVNLNGLTTANQETQTYCGDVSALGITFLDFAQITQVDSESRKRYVVVLSNPSGHVLSVGASALNYEYEIPTGAVGIGNTPHSDVGADEHGRQMFWWSWYSPYDNRYFLGTHQLNKGISLVASAEGGGGMRPFSNTQTIQDGHYGCNFRGICSSSFHTGGVTTQYVSTITAANPCQVNTTGHGYLDAASIQIGGAAGAGTSILNGIHTITLVNANAYTIPVNCLTGVTYTADSAHSAPSTAFTNSPFRSEIIVSRLGQWARRLVVHRSVMYQGGALSAYFATPRASISRDGRYIAFASNMGVPELASAYFADVGFDYRSGMKVAADPAHTSAVLNYVLPTADGAATITISTAASLATPVVNASDGLSTLARQYVATGLTANTLYYYRVASAGASNTGQFRTFPTLSGTGRAQISKGGGGTINHGPTSGLGSSCNSPCDLTPARGLFYTDATGQVKATVVR